MHIRRIDSIRFDLLSANVGSGGTGATNTQLSIIQIQLVLSRSSHLFHDVIVSFIRFVGFVIFLALILKICYKSGGLVWRGKGEMGNSVFFLE